MFKFRGQTKSGEWVVGGLTRGYVNDELRYVYHVEDDELNLYLDIQPGTLSVSTGKLDSNGVEIFASFEVGGVMTDGGDVVEVKGNQDRSNNGVFEVKYMARWDSGCEFELISAKGEEYDNSLHGGIHSSEITIIGKQGCGNEIRQN